MRLQGYSIIGRRELWWDGWDDQSAVMDRPRLVHKARRAAGLPWLCCGMTDEPLQSQWVRISWQSSVGGTVVAVCYRMSDEEQVDETFFSQLEEALCSQAHVHMGRFNHPGICWKSTTTGHMKSKRFLEIRAGDWQPKAGYWAAGEVRRFAGPRIYKEECEGWGQFSGESPSLKAQGQSGCYCEKPAAADPALSRRCWTRRPPEVPANLIHCAKCYFGNSEWNGIHKKREVV